LATLSLLTTFIFELVIVLQLFGACGCCCRGTAAIRATAAVAASSSAFVVDVEMTPVDTGISAGVGIEIEIGAVSNFEDATDNNDVEEEEEEEDDEEAEAHEFEELNG
jgi:hypothetical protein